MAYTHFKPKAGRFGAHPVFVSEAVSATQGTTVNTLIAIPKRRCWISKATVTLSTLGVATTSNTVTLQLFAVGTNGSTARAISSTLSLESDGVATALVPVNLTFTATENQRFLLEGETLRVAVVNDANLTTVPVGTTAVELLVLE